MQHQVHDWLQNFLPTSKTFWEVSSRLPPLFPPLTYTGEELRFMDWVRHVAGACAGAGCYITSTIEYELSRYVRERNYPVLNEYKESKAEKKVIRKVRNIRRSSVKNQKIRKYG